MVPPQGDHRQGAARAYPRAVSLGRGSVRRLQNSKEKVENAFDEEFQDYLAKQTAYHVAKQVAPAKAMRRRFWIAQVEAVHEWLSLPSDTPSWDGKFPGVVNMMSGLSVLYW